MWEGDVFYDHLAGLFFFLQKADIEFIYQVSAKAVDVEAKSVLLSNGVTLLYSHLVIATGGRLIRYFSVSVFTNYYQFLNLTLDLALYRAQEHIYQTFTYFEHLMTPT